MTSLPLLRRLFACLVLLWITADFMDPFTPGVFFFEHDTFFVDGAVQAKSIAAPTPVLVPATRLADTDTEKATVAKVCVVVRPLRSAVVWKNPHRGDSTSASASPQDSPAAQS